MEPWDEFTSALHRNGRKFADIVMCTDKRAVIHALGFSDILTVAAIESRWHQMILEKDVPNLGDHDSETPKQALDSLTNTQHSISDVLLLTQNRKITMEEMRGHILRLPQSAQENYLLYEVFHALAGCSGIFFLPEEHLYEQNEIRNPSSDSDVTTKSFVLHDALRPFYYSALLPVLPIVNAYLGVQQRASFFCTYNSRLDARTLQNINAAALGLGEGLNAICSEYIENISSLQQVTGTVPTIADVLFDIQKIGKRLCSAMDILGSIDTFICNSNNRARDAFFVVQHNSGDGVKALLDALYHCWVKNSGNPDYEKVASYLLSSASNAYFDFVFDWMHSGFCASAIWEGFFIPASDEDRRCFPASSLPVYLEKFQSSIVACGEWKKQLYLVELFSGSDQKELLQQFHKIEYPIFDWQFHRKIKEIVTQCLENSSTTLIHRFQTSVHIHQHFTHIHNVFFCRSNDWVDIFVRENFDYLYQPLGKTEGFSWLTEHMHRIGEFHDSPNMCFLKIDSHPFQEIAYKFFLHDENAIDGSQVANERVYAYMSIDVLFPKILQDLGFFDLQVQRQYSMIFRLIMWVKYHCSLHQMAWKLCRFSSHRFTRKMLPVQQFLHQIGLFLNQLDGWIHHTAIPLALQKFDKDLSEPHSVESIIQAHVRCMSLLLNKCFLHMTKRHDSLLKIIGIIQGFLPRFVLYNEKNKTYLLSNAFSHEHADENIIDEKNETGLQKLNQQFHHEIHTLASCGMGLREKKAISCMDFSKFCD